MCLRSSKQVTSMYGPQLNALVGRVRVRLWVKSSRKAADALHRRLVAAGGPSFDTRLAGVTGWTVWMWDRMPTAAAARRVNGCARAIIATARFPT